MALTVVLVSAYSLSCFYFSSTVACNLAKAKSDTVHVQDLRKKLEIAFLEVAALYACGAVRVAKCVFRIGAM